MRGRIESDWYPHGNPIPLEGGEIAVVTDNAGFQNAVLTVLEDPRQLRAERIYMVRVRRSFPYAAMGLPLSIKALQAGALNPNDYTGFSFQNATDRNTQTGDAGGLGTGIREDVEFLDETVLAQIIPVVMYGLGNRAMLDDTVLHTGFGNEPDPFILLYLNTEGDFVILENRKPHHRQHQRLIRRRKEVIVEPFRAESIGINRTAIEFFQPHSWGHSESFIGAAAPRLGGGCGCR